MKIIYSLFISLFLSILGCKKNDDGLPKETQSGQNVMAAKVDEEVWTNKSCFCLGNGTPDLEAIFLNNYLSIKGVQKTGKYITIELVIYNPQSGSTYELSNGYGKPFLNFARLIDSSSTFYTSTTQTGKVTLTRFDSQAKIVSGKFEFIADNGSIRTVNVVSGRFDVKFK